MNYLNLIIHQAGCSGYSKNRVKKNTSKKNIPHAKGILNGWQETCLQQCQQDLSTQIYALLEEFV